MKTNELTLKHIDNAFGVNMWYDLISKEPVMSSHKKEDWVGENIHEIFYQNKLVGYISYSRWENQYCLSCVYILEEFRHKGIATAAIRKVFFQLKGLGEYLYGFVHKDNSNAISMYSKLGFKFLNASHETYLYETPNDKCCLNEGFYEFGKRLL